MANRTLRDLPVTTVVASADLVHTSQTTTDKSVTQGKNAEYAMNLSAYAPTVVAVTGATHTISTTINKQLIICTIAATCTMTFPGTFGNNQEITILNVTGSTANVIGLPNSEVLWPGQEITFVWNGSAWIKKQFITNFITGTAAPTNTPNYIGQIFVDGTGDDVYISVGTASAADWLQLMDKEVDIIVKDVDFTILDANYEDIFIANPDTASQYGLLTITAPATGSNTSRIRRIEHGLNPGLARVNANGAQRFDFHGTDLQYILLYIPGDFIEFYWNTNTSKWSISDYKILMPTNMRNRSDWTNVHIGNGVEYDNKSAGVDFTGMVITEATSGFTAVVVEDSGGAGAAGIFYIYNLSSGFTAFTDGRVLTASDATTCDVDEVSGSSKNIDYNLYHGMGVSLGTLIPHKIISTDGSDANSFYNTGGREGGNNVGITNFYNDADSILQQTGSTGLIYVNAAGTGTTIETSDWYENTIILF